MTRHRVIAALTAVCLLVASVTSAGCGPDLTAPVDYAGTKVQEIIAQMQQSLDQVIATANDSVAQAAVLVQGQVDHFQTVYDAELNQTFVQLNDTAARQLSTLMTLTNQVQSGLTANIALATQNLQQVLNTLPGAKVPQVTRFGPHYVVGDPSASDAVVFSFEGDFVDAIRGGKFTPQLVLCPAGVDPSSQVCDGQTFSGEVETQALHFRVPLKAFPKATDTSTPVTYLYLLAPYKQGLFHFKPGTAIAREAVLSVPPTAGTIEVEPDVVPQGRTITTTKITQAGNHADQVYDTFDTVPGITPPAADETVVPSSIKFHSEAETGRWTYEVSADGRLPKVTVSTADIETAALVPSADDCPHVDLDDGVEFDPRGKPIPRLPHLCFGHRTVPGRVTFWLTYDVVKAYQKPDPIQPRWGHPSVVVVNPSGWLASYFPFPAAAAHSDTPLQIAKPNCDLDFVCFEVFQNQLTITARNLTDVPYPATFESGS